MAECDYCFKKIDGLPHRCRYCGENHCSEHLLPESHNCSGLGHSNKVFSAKPIKFNHSKDHKHHRKHFKSNPKENYSEYKEMYHPSKNHFSFRFRNPFRNIFSFRLSSEIKHNLTQFVIALFIGLVLNYVYYQNFSLHYLFIGGVQEWFNVLNTTLNFGLIGGYDVFYLIINGFFYYYLFSTTVKLFYSIITHLGRKSTWWFLLGVGILVFVIFKYFPNLIY